MLNDEFRREPLDRVSVPSLRLTTANVLEIGVTFLSASSLNGGRVQPIVLRYRVEFCFHSAVSARVSSAATARSNLENF